MQAKKLLSLLLVLLVGCSSVPRESVELSAPAPKSVQMPPPAPPPAAAVPAAPYIPPPVATSSPPVTMSGNLPNIVTRDYMIPSQRNQSFPFSVLLLPKKAATEADKKRYEYICRLWLATFTLNEELLKYKDGSYNTIPLYWFITKKPRKEDCDELLANYDYPRAQIYASVKKLSPVKTLMVCELSTGFVLLDLSNLEKEDDIELAFEAWVKNMRQIPKAGTTIRPYDMMTSAKVVLGALGSLVTIK